MGRDMKSKCVNQYMVIMFMTRKKLRCYKGWDLKDPHHSPILATSRIIGRATTRKLSFQMMKQR